MKPKLIIDTNKARNDKGFDQLLGNRVEIEKLAEKCDIILPSMVIDEIIHQKREYFRVAKQSFMGSHLYGRLPKETKVQIDGHLQFDEDALRADQSIPYATIDIQDKSMAFDEIRSLAIKHEAPFEIYSVELGKNKNTNTDKGFKDSYIALTIVQYVNSLPADEKVFVLVRDRRLEEYLDKNDRIICISSLDDFNARYQIIETRSATMQATARIITEPVERQEIKSLLTELRNVPNFVTTHKLIPKLAAVISRFTSDDYVDVLMSTAQNSQVNWLLGDEDVRNFILPIFNKYGEQLSTEQYNVIASGLGLEEKKVALTSPDIDFDEIDGQVDSWIELQSDIARGK